MKRCFNLRDEHTRNRMSCFWFSFSLECVPRVDFMAGWRELTRGRIPRKREFPDEMPFGFRRLRGHHHQLQTSNLCFCMAIHGKLGIKFFPSFAKLTSEKRGPASSVRREAKTAPESKNSVVYMNLFRRCVQYAENLPSVVYTNLFQEMCAVRRKPTTKEKKLPSPLP